MTYDDRPLFDHPTTRQPLTPARAAEIARLLNRLAASLPVTDSDHWQARSMARALIDDTPAGT